MCNQRTRRSIVQASPGPLVRRRGARLRKPFLRRGNRAPGRRAGRGWAAVAARRRQWDAALADRGRPGAAGPGGGTAGPSKAAGRGASLCSPPGGSSGVRWGCRAAPGGCEPVLRVLCVLRGGAVSPAPEVRRPEVRSTTGRDGVGTAGVWVGSVSCWVWGRHCRLCPVPRNAEPSLRLTGISNAAAGIFTLNARQTRGSHSSAAVREQAVTASCFVSNVSVYHGGSATDLRHRPKPRLSCGFIQQICVRGRSW